MCIECRKNPCHPMCPNAPEQEVVGECMNCKGYIFKGNEIWKDECEYKYCCQDCAIDFNGIKEIC